MQNNFYFVLYKLWKNNRQHPIMATLPHTKRYADVFWDSKKDGTYYANGARGSVVESWHKKARELKNK